MTEHPITKAKPSKPLADVLQETLKVHADALFAKSFQEVTRSPQTDPATPLTLKEYLVQTKSTWSLPALPSKMTLPGLARKIVKTGLQVVGSVISYPISQKDIRLFARGEDAKSIYLHRPLVLWCQVMLNWVIKVLDTALLSPKLSDSDKALLQKAYSALHDFNQGFSSGVVSKETHLRLLRTLKVLRRSKSLDLGLDSRIFETLERNLAVYFAERKSEAPK